MRCILPFSWRPKSSGFTLVELMITVAIVGVLAAIAYPSYIEYVKRGRRAELTAQMLAASQFMERYYTENREYPDNDEFVKKFRYSPPEVDVRARASYELRLENPTSRQSFKINARRGEMMEGDRCGGFTLDNLGRKNVENIDEAKFDTHEAAIEYCWR